MLRLNNWRTVTRNVLKVDSNTTNVKVKPRVLTNWNGFKNHSNTTNVKVKQLVAFP